MKKQQKFTTFSFPARDMDKAEVFNGFFACAFGTHDAPRGSHSPELEDYDCNKDWLPIDSKIVQDLLLQLDPSKSIGLDGINLKTLKELLMSLQNISL